MIAAAALAVFGVAVALLAHSYFLYPAILMLLSRGRGDAQPALPAPGPDLPHVTVVVAAFNEEVHIAARIENLLAQDYPADRLRILVGSDGSRDRTVAEARRIVSPRVRVEAFEVNRGKASVLNDLVALADSPIVVFTDANTVFRPDAVRQLMAAMGDGSGAACGELVLAAAGEEGSNVDHKYWSLESRLKRAESRLGGLLGANGGVYAIRRECYTPLPPDTICDDFVIAMNISVAGRGLRFVPAAVAYEDIHADVQSEYHRRVRIGIGNYQALFRHPEYLFGAPWILRFTYFSHKVIRWFTPHLLLLILLSSLVLAAQSPAFALLAVLQLAAYAAAALVHFGRDRFAWPGVARGWSYFALLNAAFLVGFRRYLAGSYAGSWRRTERQPARS
jgi:cellulose synthase/poly-beta-1,6-N-acetylglucosamine synthase-like glycosyltransferase